MRKRGTSTPQVESISTAYKLITGTSWVPGTPGSFSWKNHEFMEDVVTAGFKIRSARGEVVISPMLRWASRGQFLPTGTFTTYGKADSQGRRAGWKQSSLFAPVYAPSDSPAFGHQSWTTGEPSNLISRVEGLAITDAYAKVGQPDMSTLVSLGELPETLAFLYSPVRKMTTFINRAKRWKEYYQRTMATYERKRKSWENLPARVRAKRQPPQRPDIRPFKVGRFEAVDISSFWLGIRYGLMPLIYEFEDLQKALKAAMRPARETARAKASEKSVIVVKQYDVVSGSDTNAGSYTSQISHILTMDVTSRAGVLYEPQTSWTSRWGIELNRVPAAAYELIPLSFVADWFWNGAAAYDALTAELRARKILGAWVSTIVTYSFDVKREIIAQGPNTLISGSGGTFYREEGVVKMRRKTSLADVRVYARVRLNAKRVVDGLALIHMFLASGRGR